MPQGNETTTKIVISPLIADNYLLNLLVYLLGLLKITKANGTKFMDKGKHRKGKIFF